jgi:predicted TIM-barrel fold metal-dependent hydrolase
MIRRKGEIVRYALLLLAVSSGCGRCGGCSGDDEVAAVPRAEGYRRIDAHAHIQPGSTDEALGFYRRFGVEAAINVSGRYPGRGLEEAAEAANGSGGRLYFMCNIPWLVPVDDPRFLQMALTSLERCFGLGGLAWKIHKMLGLAATYSDGSLVPVDAPELDPIFERAGELGMPVLIHSGDPQAFFEPVGPENERVEELTVHPHWSFYGDEYPSWEEVFAQFERRVARHPGVTFIGAHFGNAPEEPRRVAAMLERYPNLMIDTAARVPEIGRQNSREMHDLFVRFQDRILFATDLGYGRDLLGERHLALGSSGAEEPTSEEIERFWSATWRYFETWDAGFPNPTPIQGRWPVSGVGLPREVLEKIYRRNAERILGIRLPD